MSNDAFVSDNNKSEGSFRRGDDENDDKLWKEIEDTVKDIVIRERIRKAYNRAKSYSTRFTTVTAQDFFRNWTTTTHDDDLSSSLPKRLRQLVSSLEEKDDIHDAKVNAAIFSMAPGNFLQILEQFLTIALQTRQAQYNNDDDEDVDSRGSNNMSQVYLDLQFLKWIPYTKCNRPFGQALHNVITTHLREQIAGQYYNDNDDNHESSVATFSYQYCIQPWKENVIDGWVKDVIGVDIFEKDKWSSKLDYAVAEAYCNIRMEEMFDIVADFPDTMPAVHELQHVLQRTRMQDKLATQLRISLSKRLLHPGAQTQQIIDVYINTILVLREMDPSDALLEIVAKPIRSYLRSRSDTVRCIISSLTDEEAGGDLYEELQRHDAQPLDNAQYDSDDEDEAPSMDWQPAPSLYQQRLTGVLSFRNNHPNEADLLAMLVSIYGTKDLFVDEYRVIVADKLLVNSDFDTDKEVHNLELLKLRFGEMSMRQCEIMIKDIDDSKRIVSNIHSTLRNKKSTPVVVDAAIVSHIFWPSLQKDTMKNHPRIQAQLDEFSKEYAKLKNPRRLIWLDQLGTVKLELEVTDDDDNDNENDNGLPTTKEFTCTPLQATIISHFEDRYQWTASQLSNELQIPEEAIRKKIGYWVKHRVIKVVTNGKGMDDITYEIVSPDDLANASDLGLDAYDDEGEDFAVSLDAAQEEEMQVYESYVCGMLSNLGQLPLERIHNMLKMFASGSEHKYNKTPQQLSIFLQQLCKDDKLELTPDGMYRLIKK